MTTLRYDGSFKGLLTAIFEVFEFAHKSVTIVPQALRQQGMFDNAMLVISNVAKATRVWNGLREKLTPKSRDDFYYTFLSGLSGMEDNLLAYVRHVYNNSESVEGDYTHPAVLFLSQTARRVHHEKHRMEAFVRFTRLQDDLYASFISPDYNVLPIIAPHFQDRYADQHWLIYDRKRSYGIHHDATSHAITEVVIECSETGSMPLLMHKDEEAYQTLWKTYFDHVNIAERRNIKLHIKHIPKRYWADLTEKR